MTAAAEEQPGALPGERHESVWHLGGLGWKQLIRRVWSASDDDDIFNRAYELAYNFLIAVFPLLLFLMAVFGLFASDKAKLSYDLFRYFQEILPPLAVDLLQKTVVDVIQTGNGGKLTFGLLIALYAGSSGTTQLISTLNVAYRVRETRSWIKVRFISLTLTLVISLLIIIASFMVLAGGLVAEFLGREIGWSSFIIAGWKALQLIMAISFVLIAYALVYYFGPNRKNRRWHWISPGSVAGVSLWLIASGALRLYLHFITSYSRSYGSVGAVIILLLWFHVTGLAFLIGAEVNTVIENATAERLLEKAKGPQAA